MQVYLLELIFFNTEFMEIMCLVCLGANRRGLYKGSAVILEASMEAVTTAASLETGGLGHCEGLH